MDYKLEDDDYLLRLNFAPQHIVDGKVIPAAISSEDLQRRGYSLDCEKLVSTGTLTARAISQSEKKPEERKLAHISRFRYDDASAIRYGDIQAFNIYHSPLMENLEKSIEANPAHVSLLCTDTGQGPSYYKKAKALLLPVLQNLITLQNYVDKIPAQSHEEDTGTTSLS